MRKTGIHAESEQFVQSYKCSSGIFTQQGSTVVYKEKQINLHNMESVHTRILTIVPLTAKGQVSSPEYFFFPRDSGKGKLIAPQGLISITQKERPERKKNIYQSNILVINPTNKYVKLKKGWELGSIHEINDDDVEQTELLQISNHSLLDLQDIQPVKKVNTKEQDQKSKEKKSFNSKVGANYFKALNSPWLDAWVAKENKMLFLKEG